MPHLSLSCDSRIIFSLHQGFDLMSRRSFANICILCVIMSRVWDGQFPETSDEDLKGWYFNWARPCTKKMTAQTINTWWEALLVIWEIAAFSQQMGWQKTWNSLKEPGTDLFTCERRVTACYWVRGSGELWNDRNKCWTPHREGWLPSGGGGGEGGGLKKAWKHLSCVAPTIKAAAAAARCIVPLITTVALNAT